MDSGKVLIELGAVLIGLSVLARIAGLLRIPAIPLYLIAGLAFGEGGVLPLVTTQSFVQLGAEVGLILLLFSLGLEYSARELVTTLRRQTRAGLLDAVLNFIPGFVAGILLGWAPIAAAVLGGITYVSSSGIAAKLLHDFGWVRRPEGRVVVSLLIIEDLAMAVYLPALAGLLIAGGVSTQGLVGSLVALGVVAVFLVGALKLEFGITRFIFSRSDEALLFTIIGLAVLGAGIAELVEISAAVGALLVGIGMSGPGIEDARRLLVPLRDFFAALFFALFGLSINPSELPPVLLTAGILAAVTAATKFVGGWLIGGRAGLDNHQRARVGVLLIARGEFSIVIATIAVASGHEFVGPLAAAYVLLLALVTPLLTRLTGEPPPRKPRTRLRPRETLEDGPLADERRNPEGKDTSLDFG
ncbi:MAG: cation:proton antiporter [Actinomycetota bacterium]